LLDPKLRARSVVAEIKRSSNGAQHVFRVARHPLQATDGRSSEGHVWSVRDISQQQLAEQARDQFLDMVSHELRTPLANLKAYAETLILTEQLDVAKQKDFCNIINAEATRLARLVDDLLSISSMEVGSLSLSREETDMERLLQEVVNKVRPQMDQKGTVFNTTFPEKWPKLHLDKDKMAATLVNLLGNAVKYTPGDGRVILKVSVTENDFRIEMEDTGVGISAEELPKVFDKFFRSSDPRVQKESGSGLGLAFAQEVVRMHSGTLTVQSQPGTGSKFTVTLPKT
jgi:two-component system phosphate regulon sensor histidine kinase PhoR